MDKITEKLAMDTNLLTYGMIGMTTIILAALTVFDSSNTGEEETSYVSQLFGTEESNEAGLISSIVSETQEENNSSTNITGGRSNKTRRYKNKHTHKKTKATRK